MARIYIVTPTKKLPDHKQRLVRAETQTQALKFATADFYEVAVATPDQLVELASSGTKVEDAKEE